MTPVLGNAPIRCIHRFTLTACGLALLLLPACGTYQIQGRVIEGATPALLIVNAKDTRMEGLGMPAAVIESVLDPDRPLQQVPLEPQMTDGNGYFAVPVHATGAGMLNYNVQIIARLAGHTAVRRTIKLPGRDKRILIIIAPGDSGSSSVPLDEPDILEETRRMGEQLNH